MPSKLRVTSWCVMMDRLVFVCVAMYALVVLGLESQERSRSFIHSVSRKILKALPYSFFSWWFPDQLSYARLWVVLAAYLHLTSSNECLLVKEGFLCFPHCITSKLLFLCSQILHSILLVSSKHSRFVCVCICETGFSVVWRGRKWALGQKYLKLCLTESKVCKWFTFH